MLNFRDLALRRGTRFLFEHATFSLFRGDKAGIVGPNGAGKSSLFALIRGELSPEAGEFELPRGLNVASVAQEIDADPRPAVDFVQDGDRELREVEAGIRAATDRGDGLELARLHATFDAIGGYSAPARAARLLDGLGFTPADHSRPVAAFSGGWRVRLALAQALMCRSDLLLLDEPTNHLDLDAVVWLEDWLRSYPGTLLVISHDREFLDRVVSRIVSLESGTIGVYSGNYSAFEVERAARLAERSAAHAKQERERRHVQAFVERFRAKASKARQAQSRLKWLERMEKIAPAHVDSPFEFAFLEPLRLPRPLLSLRGVAVGYDSTVVLEGISLSIQPGDRIALLGRNGAGKSTLTRALAGESTLLRGERMEATDLAIGYFAQHQVEQLDGAETPLWHLARYGGASIARAPEAEQRSFLGGFGFSGERVFEPVEPFSGGERARLVLALVVSRRPNLLLLDEPTNHLDLEMRHALAMALQDYEGAIVVVSHDRHLLRLVADTLWLVADRHAQPFDGDLDDYADWLRSATAAARTAAPSAAGSAPQGGGSAARAGETRDSAKERKRLEAAQRARLAPLRQAVQTAERQMESEAKLLRAVEARLADPALYEPTARSALEQALAEQRAAQRRMSESEEAWLSASDELERLATS